MFLDFAVRLSRVDCSRCVSLDAVSSTRGNQQYWDFGWHHGMGRRGAFERMWDVDFDGRLGELLESRLPSQRGEQLPGHVRVWDHATPVSCGRRACGVDVAAGLPGAPIVSDRARGVLERFVGSNVQFLGVVPMIGKRTMAVGPYWIVNIVRLLDCIDWKATPYRRTRSLEYRTVEGDIVLRPDRIPVGMHIFKCRYCPGPVIVSDTLRRSMQRAKLTGSVYFGNVGAWIRRAHSSS